MIGIVGGVGPYAGIDLLKNIYDNTLAQKDQDYLNTLLFSLSAKILDRTEYLMGAISENPGHEMAKIVLVMEKLGVKVVGIPCNTAHSQRIFSVILEELQKNESKVKMVHMIQETIDFIKVNFPNFKKIGTLSTTGTYRYKLYSNALTENGFVPLQPSLEMQEELVHPAIYHPEYGIKSQFNPHHPQARINLDLAIDYLRDQGAEAVILGCTEIPLVIDSKEVKGLTMINPTNVLARKLIQHIAPNKLKPLKIHE